jgi:hypothetical protein
MARNQMLPGVRVRVALPAPEHLIYKNQLGHIDDVRDFGQERFCLVVLESGEVQNFEATELESVTNT